MQASPPKQFNRKEVPLQLLLFVDKRPSSAEQIRQIRDCLEELRSDFHFDLQVVDVGEQPYLAEHFKLVATPSLIKIHPEPRQVIAGSDLVSKLMGCWPRWRRSAEDYTTDFNPAVGLMEQAVSEVDPSGGSIAYSAELLRLSDEIFRLKQEKEELLGQLQFKDRIIAMLAHDLRNPLTATSIALETLEMALNPKDGQPSRLPPGMINQLLKHARTQTRAIDRLITDILQAARGTQAELRIQFRQLDLGELCQDVLDSLRGRMQGKAQQLELDIPSDLPPVHADAERVRQVVINLLDNAIKYTPHEGTIRLSILHRTTQKVQVSICDNGPGIPEEDREVIFEDHFRLKRDEAAEGYGIGLSLCRRIIRAHYGQIWVDTDPTHGSCFHFTLPVFRS
ncbi:histidine kinase [Leptolyngbya sp. 'hensonii']|uniref:histidine kinase n=1 Tax=Leptolyngbya sp. 'hensonii' TaxID=1922337 RepID=UPI00094F7FC5|nr:histidine kinase [Leptolyngbya sp. 'hensonii']OLP18017.1 histidine kinase [Leptolyngbya sp. 'hensonii']